MAASRIATYVPLVQQFAARAVLFHAAVAERLGIHVTDLKCLRLLGDRSMTAGEISAALGLTGAAATAVIGRLKKAGFVARRGDPADGRRVVIRANPKKIAAVDALYDSQAQAMTKLLSRYSEAQFAAIADFLERTTIVLTEETLRLQT